MKTKTFLLIVLFSIGISTTSFAQGSNSKGPSLEETIEWINTKISLWGNGIMNQSKIDGLNFLITNHKWEEGSETGVYGYLKVDGLSIKSISFDKWEDGTWKISISGKYGWEVYKAEYKRQDISAFKRKNYDSEAVAFMNLDKTISESDVNKFVKALKHWATLWGAQLVNEDLF